MAIYLPEKHLIFHPMMRTGSSATAMFLKSLGGELRGRHHDLMKKESSQDIIFSTVRNHFDFLVSGWHRVKEKIEFSEWLRRFVGPLHCSQKLQIPSGHKNPTINVSGTNLFNNKTILSADKLIKYESLENDLGNLLEMKVEIPVHNVTPNKRDYRTYYTQKDIDLVYEHYGHEMKKFGYSFDNGLQGRDFV